MDDLQNALLGRRNLNKLKLLNELQAMTVKVISLDDKQHLIKKIVKLK